MPPMQRWELVTDMQVSCVVGLNLESALFCKMDLNCSDSIWCQPEGTLRCGLVQAIEEACCSMHLAVAGSSSGLHAMQMVCHVPYIPVSVLEAAIRRAKQGIMQRLGDIEASSRMVRSSCLLQIA